MLVYVKKLLFQILSESEQLRREVDSSGPQDELEYWKKRGAQFSQLVSYLQVSLVLYKLQFLYTTQVKQKVVANIAAIAAKDI